VTMTHPPRPFSDAETTFMPELYPDTVPIARVENKCGWCGIRLAAIPDAPREYAGMYFHPGGCVAAARGASRGERTE
jgi:hypothetical protein